MSWCLWVFGLGRGRGGWVVVDGEMEGSKSLSLLNLRNQGRPDADGRLLSPRHFFTVSRRNRFFRSFLFNSVNVRLRVYSSLVADLKWREGRKGTRGGSSASLPRHREGKKERGSSDLTSRDSGGTNLKEIELCTGVKWRSWRRGGLGKSSSWRRVAG